MSSTGGSPSATARKSFAAIAMGLIAAALEGLAHLREREPKIYAGDGATETADAAPLAVEYPNKLTGFRARTAVSDDGREHRLMNERSQARSHHDSKAHCAIESSSERAWLASLTGT